MFWWRNMDNYSWIIPVTPSYLKHWSLSIISHFPLDYCILCFLKRKPAWSTKLTKLCKPSKTCTYALSEKTVAIKIEEGSSKMCERNFVPTPHTGPLQIVPMLRNKDRVLAFKVFSNRLRILAMVFHVSMILIACSRKIIWNRTVWPC